MPQFFSNTGAKCTGHIATVEKCLGILTPSASWGLLVECRGLLPCGTLLSLQLEESSLSGTMPQNYSAVIFDIALDSNNISGTINQLLPCTLKILRIDHNFLSGTLSKGVPTEAVANFNVFESVFGEAFQSQMQLCPLFWPTWSSLITLSVGENQISGQICLDLSFRLLLCLSVRLLFCLSVWFWLWHGFCFGFGFGFGSGWRWLLLLLLVLVWF